MALTVFPVGQQDVTTYWIAYNNTTGARRTDITHSTAGLTLAFTRIRAADVTAVAGGSPAPVTLAADNSAHADWGVRHVGGGKLRIDWPDAAFVTGVDSVVLDVYGPADTVFVPAGGLVDLPLSNPRAAGLTESGIAAAVWAASTRTLSSFGTLVADAAAAVWAVATRTLSSGGNTAIAAATRTNLEGGNPIPVNTARMNNVPVQGNGTEANLWRGGV